MSIIITGLLKKFVGSDVIIEARYGRGGEPQAITDLLGGAIHAMVASTNTLMPHAQAGTIRIIGAIGGRNPFMPDVLPLSQQKTLKTSEFVGQTEQLMPWNGLLAPKGTPEGIVRTLSAALKDVLEDPEVVRGLTNARLVSRYSEPREFSALIHDRLLAVTKILRDSQVKLR